MPIQPLAQPVDSDADETVAGDTDNAEATTPETETAAVEA